MGSRLEQDLARTPVQQVCVEHHQAEAMRRPDSGHRLLHSSGDYKVVSARTMHHLQYRCECGGIVDDDNGQWCPISKLECPFNCRPKCIKLGRLRYHGLLTVFLQLGSGDGPSKPGQKDHWQALPAFAREPGDPPSVEMWH